MLVLRAPCAVPPTTRRVSRQQPAAARPCLPLPRGPTLATLVRRACKLPPRPQWAVRASASAEEGCRPVNVYATEDETQWTKLTIEVGDFPGLVRVIAWVLNGLNIRVQRAKLWTTPDGFALDTFWISDLDGKRLSTVAAGDVAARICDYLTECSPKAAEQPNVLNCGDVCIDSSDATEECTLVKVASDPRNTGQLLELASTLSGLGITIREADLEQDGRAGAWVFRVLSASCEKLNYSEAAALLFLLGGPMGKRSGGRGQTSVPL